MNIPGKIASSTLILIGFAWLVSLFFNPKTWGDRSANQLNATPQGGVTGQNFTTSGNATRANGSQATIDQGTMSPQSTQQQRVQQVPQTLGSPDQSAQPNPSPSPTTAVSPTPQPTFEATPAPQPSPSVVAEPVRAGW